MRPIGPTSRSLKPVSPADVDSVMETEDIVGFAAGELFWAAPEEQLLKKMVRLRLAIVARATREFIRSVLRSFRKIERSLKCSLESLLFILEILPEVDVMTLFVRDETCDSLDVRLDLLHKFEDVGSSVES